MSKNVHLTHAPEAIFVGGPAMAATSQEIMYDLAKKLQAEENISGVSIKFDGAPAVFCGFDPEDGDFFVGTKGVFNATPKLAKSVLDCERLYTGDLQAKMISAWVNLQTIFPSGYKKILQGDLMFTKSDLKIKTILGDTYVTCHPNTIAYAAALDSELANSWRNSEIGIVFHTFYTGKGTLQDYKANFGFSAKELKKSSAVWYDDANVKSFSQTMPRSTALEIMKKTRVIKKYLNNDSQRFFLLQESFKSTVAGAKFATFWNSHIRKGTKPKKAYQEYVKYVDDYYEQRRIGKLKSEKGQVKAREEKEQLLKQLKINKKGLEDSWKWATAMTEITDVMLEVLDKMAGAKTFLQMKDGSFKVTKPEGYVAFGKDGSAVKLVDRFVFSYANFSDTIKKGWQNTSRS